MNKHNFFRRISGLNTEPFDMNSNTYFHNATKSGMTKEYFKDNIPTFKLIHHVSQGRIQDFGKGGPKNSNYKVTIFIIQCARRRRAIEGRLRPEWAWGVRGHDPPGNFWNINALSCILSRLTQQFWGFPLFKKYSQ